MLSEKEKVLVGVGAAITAGCLPIGQLGHIAIDSVLGFYKRRMRDVDGELRKPKGIRHTQ